jgi:hypothetical protein
VATFSAQERAVSRSRSSVAEMQSFGIRVVKVTTCNCGGVARFFPCQDHDWRPAVAESSTTKAPHVSREMRDRVIFVVVTLLIGAGIGYAVSRTGGSSGTQR